MTQLFHPLLALIASASDSHLRRQVRYLKEENQIAPLTRRSAVAEINQPDPDPNAAVKQTG
ncbi:MAG: hypothetical protein ACON4H_18715 [Rubripirellula sp.]